MAHDKIEFRRKVAFLTAKVQALHSKGLTVGETLDGDLVSIMQSESSKVQNTLPDGSFRTLFWQEQMKALSCQDPRQRRWHPMIIKWCLNLRMLSTAAYHNMRTTGMLVLPSEKTLSDYSNAIKGGEGFNMEVLRMLFNEASLGQDAIPYHRQ